jgi:uncharacterized RDD family membrane protein YckC
MQGEWWYSTGDKRKGPVPLQKLRELYLKGSVTESSLVWTDGMDDWAHLREVPELAAILRSVPPELPPASSRDRLISLPLAGPWRRFFARSIDLWTLGPLTGYLVATAMASFSDGFALWLQRPGSDYAFGWLVLPVILVVEAIIFGLFGTTLGKGLLGVRVTRVSGDRPTFNGYLKRQIGVYWYGLGTGFPLVTLFTMARQYGHLKASRQTAYDSGEFSVRAPRLGILRAVVATVVVGALLLVNGLFQSMSNESQRRLHTETPWTNSVSGRTVSIPAGWIHERQQNDDNQTVHVFAGPNLGVYVVFAHEDIHRSMSLDDYAKAWVSAIRDSMRLSIAGPTTTSAGKPGLQATGTLTGDPGRKVQATLVKSGPRVWRSVLVGTSGQEPANPAASNLQALLFSTVD